MNKEGRTYFEAFEHGIGALVKRIASKVLPEAPLKTRVGLAILGTMLLFISTFGVYWFLNTMRLYSSYLGLMKWLTYQVVIDTFLIIGSIYLLLGKRLGWLIVTSFLVMRFLPRMDRLIGVFYWENSSSSITESLFGFGFPEAGIIMFVLALLLVFMYSGSVRALYGINKRAKFIPVVAVLLFESAWTVLSYFL